MDINTKNTHNLDIDTLSLKAKNSIMLMTIERIKHIFLKKYDVSTLYRAVDRMLDDFWKWNTSKHLIQGKFIYYTLSNQKIESQYLGVEFLYYNHKIDLMTILDGYESLGDDATVLSFGVDYCLSRMEIYDRLFLQKEISLPSEIYEVNSDEFFATLNYAIEIIENPIKEQEWQRKALGKLLKNHSVAKVGEWGEPIEKSFFDDI